MKKTGLFAIILALCVLTCSIPVAAVFADIANSDYETAVSALYDVGVITGHPDGSYRPESELTLAEAVTLLSRAFGLERTGVNNAAGLAGHWAFDAAMACLDSGYSMFEILRDSSADSMDQQITPAIFAGSIYECLQGRYGSEYDADYAVPYNGDISADNSLTRGDAAIMLYDALCNEYGPRDASIYDTLLANTILESARLLRYYTLAGYYEDDMVHAVALTENPDAYVYDYAYGGFVPIEASPQSIVYNFVAVYSSSGDATGDTLFIVNREDGDSFWDSMMDYDSEDDAAAFGNVYNIPFGERLLGHEGIFDGAIVDFLNLATPGDLSTSPYYYTYDWYNSTSTDTLTMLTGFRTAQQTTGWACGVTCAIMAMDWFGMRGGLNELDLSALRNTKEKYGAYRWGSATDVMMLINVFDALNDMEGDDIWTWISTYDFVDDDGNLDDEYLSTEWIQEMLGQGIPILVGWNSFGAHWQVIIGYDDMGTADTADDVLLLADPYDTTDHLNDGINIQSYERLYWDWTQNFDRDFGRGEGYGMPVIFAIIPSDYDADGYSPTLGDGLVVYTPAIGTDVNASDDMLIPYGNTAADLAASDYSYTKAETGDNGMAGAAGSDYYRMSQHITSQYFPQIDFYNGAEGVSDTLILLEGFATSQQASEWTCGPASLRMVLYWYELMGDETEFSLASLRENDREGATTLDGMIQMIDALGADLAYFTTDNLDDDDCIAGLCLYDGLAYEGLIPFCLQNGIPILIGWDEWGGHWQVIVGYDDMGTDDTQDDVLILADPYDTTDHLQDGYVIESFERLVYGWGAAFDERRSTVFVIPFPTLLLTSLWSAVS